FLAVGKAKQGGILSIGRQGLFFVPLILILPNLFGIHGMIWTQPAADAITIILTAIFAIGENRELNRLC
ncbi:MAG: MATE family efflux transporter, partial [Clostridia bacterium]|nr:MATE family efflux transporter [Clostridia bacterium]